VTTVLLLASAPSPGQAPSSVGADDQINDEIQTARAERIAQQFENNSRQLTVFDRGGRLIRTVRERDMYIQPKLSPDLTRLAVIKRDLEAETADLWVLDVATGDGTQITSVQPQERAQTPVWSPDGSQVAYVALRDSYFGVYRKASNGEGEEELLYQHAGGPIILSSWSVNGRLLSFSTGLGNLAGSVLYLLPLDGDGQVIELARSEAGTVGATLSPDNRFLAYKSDETGRNEIFVRAVANPGQGEAASDEKWQISTEGAIGLQSWRKDGEELYYLGTDKGVMAVEVNTAEGFEFGEPRRLFTAPEEIPPRTGGGIGAFSQNGEQLVFALPPASILQQITVLDREGNVVSTVGEPGRYSNPALSPDGSRVAIQRQDERTGDLAIWTFDVASGRGMPVTNNSLMPFFTPIWSPDGSDVAYVGFDTPFTSIYRQAWDGTGDEEQLYQYTPGAGMVLTDWSADGEFLTFNDGCEGLLYVVPLSGDQTALERPAIEWLRDEYSVAQARVSPDSRFIAYLSDEIEFEVFEVYVRPFDANRPEAGAEGADPVQVSGAGARGMVFWRQDGKELFYLTPDWEVMVVDVTTTPTFQAGTPRLLFTLPGRLDGNPRQWKNVSRDGQRFVFAIDVPIAPRAE
jgi:Tol biopolymer transport system component